MSTKAKVRLVEVERSNFVVAYSARIEVDGRHRGYVQKRVGRDTAYQAFADGLRIASTRTLAELRADVAEYFKEER